MFLATLLQRPRPRGGPTFLDGSGSPGASRPKQVVVGLFSLPVALVCQFGVCLGYGVENLLLELEARVLRPDRPGHLLQQPIVTGERASQVIQAKAIE